ncbi:MAG TPA: hypothetical protein DDZ83_07670 [Nitrospinae bacterium]|nr:hypothetical protein [Nitrospinota bacterium]
MRGLRTRHIRSAPFPKMITAPNENGPSRKEARDAEGLKTRKHPPRRRFQVFLSLFPKLSESGHRGKKNGRFFLGPPPRLAGRGGRVAVWPPSWAQKTGRALRDAVNI